MSIRSYGTVAQVFVILICFFVSAHSQNCIDLGGSQPLVHNQNFDGLGQSPAPQNGDPINVQVLNPSSPRRYLGKFDNATADNSGSVNVPGWALVEEGTSASSVTGRYNVGDGSANGGNTYSFGNSVDRALGSLNDDTVARNFLGGCFRNVGTGSLSMVSIRYTGEMWRRGASGTQVDTLRFEYAVNATNIYAGTFLNFALLDLLTPNIIGSAGLRDGNIAANQTVFPLTIVPVSLAPGDTFYVRWVDDNISGQDDGLGIDEFTISFFQPSAADVSVSGRVVDFTGRPISNAGLRLTDLAGGSTYARTNPFGFYRFTSLRAGSSYLLEASAKNRQFEVSSVLLQPTESLTDIDFISTHR